MQQLDGAFASSAAKGLAPLERDPDRDAVRAYLDKVLMSPAFHGSKRCQELLRYLVEKSLNGDANVLKERSIGTAVYSREPGYDTAADAIVRVKANEVRKRLAAYYGREGSDDPLRIELPVGSYVPVFRWAEHSRQLGVANGRSWIFEDGSAHAETDAPDLLARLSVSRRLFPVAALGLGLAGGAWIARRHSLPRAAFWTPFYDADPPVLLGIPARERWFFDSALAQRLREAATRNSGRMRLDIAAGGVMVAPQAEMSVQNLRAVLHLVEYFSKHRTPIDVRLVSEISAEAIRRRNVILLGAYHNPWVMGFSDTVRYVFESSKEGSEESCWVRDRQSTRAPVWLVPKLWPFAPQQKDYAIISRIRIPTTDQVIVFFAGINGFGTQVAAEFLTSTPYLEQLTRLLPKGWETKNCQVVLETEIVQNVPSPPKIIAAHSW